jgi:hypothetical protein
MTKIKIALAAALFAATGSAAFAQGRYDANAPVQQHRNVRLHSAPVLQQRDISLPSEGASAGPFWYRSSGPTSGGM